MKPLTWLIFIWVMASTCRAENIVVSKALDWEPLSDTDRHFLEQEAKQLRGSLLDSSYHVGTNTETFAIRIPIGTNENIHALDQTVLGYLHGAAANKLKIRNQQPVSIASLKGIRISSQFVGAKHPFPVLTYLLVDDRQLYALFFIGISGERDDQVLLDNYFARIQVDASSKPQIMAGSPEYSAGEHLGMLIYQLKKLHERPGADEVLVGHGEVSEATTLITSVWDDALSEYHKDFGHYPSGTNRDITRTLCGLNYEAQNLLLSGHQRPL